MGIIIFITISILGYMYLIVHSFSIVKKENNSKYLFALLALAFTFPPYCKSIVMLSQDQVAISRDEYHNKMVHDTAYIRIDTLYNQK